MLKLCVYIFCWKWLSEIYIFLRLCFALSLCPSVDHLTESKKTKTKARNWTAKSQVSSIFSHLCVVTFSFSLYAFFDFLFLSLFFAIYLYRTRHCFFLSSTLRTFYEEFVRAFQSTQFLRISTEIALSWSSNRNTQINYFLMLFNLNSASKSEMSFVYAAPFRATTVKKWPKQQSKSIHFPGFVCSILLWRTIF